MEEFFLRALLSGDELYIIDQEHVAPEPIPVSELFHLIGLYAVYHLVRKMLRGDAADPGHVGCGFDDVIADGVDEMGFSETHASVNEEGVVGLARFSCDRGR